MTSPAARSVDGRRERGARTRDAVLARAVAIASEHGLEGLSIGGLADDLGMSKSGLFAHFGSKEELQLAAVDAAREIFVQAVVEPVGDRRGVARVEALTAAFVDYIRRSVFPGGCFFAAAASEFDGRPGPVREAVVGNMLRWRAALQRALDQAVADGELRPDVDTARVAYEVGSLLSGVNADYQLTGDPIVFDYVTHSVRERLDGLRAR
jgi:AcrR family transcriptional regulator